MNLKEQFRLRGEPELRASIAATLQGHDVTEGVWIFGYGSLIWNPGFRHTTARDAQLKGYHRRLCVESKVYRGTPEAPGLVLGLDQGGCCHGRVFHIAPDDLDSELLEVWEREMFDESYLPAWVHPETPAGPVEALTFVVNRDTDLYIPERSLAEMTDVVTQAAGERGTCEEYLRNTVEALRHHELPDPDLEAILAAVDAHRGPS